MRPNTRNYHEIFLNNTPLLDVRAPIEFNKGAFPHAINHGLMNDEERHQVGICYKSKGQEAALQLGHQLVQGQLKQARLEAWLGFFQAHPNAYLYCFRGGLRSQITQAWLQAETGHPYPRVIGGYKALRTFLLEQLEQQIASSHYTVLGGMTGTGKTDVLKQLPHALDLEAHAHHRGSSFGKHASPQPTQINFENRLAITWLQLAAKAQQHVVLEDESRLIGSCSLPISLYQRMQQSQLVWLEDSLENRVERILRDYVVELLAEFVAAHGQQAAFPLFAHRLRQSLDRIAKRLGHQQHSLLAAMMDQALTDQARSAHIDGHRAWIHGLLAHYYDPMYAYQRQQKADRVLFQGNAETVIAYLQDQQRR